MLGAFPNKYQDIEIQIDGHVVVVVMSRPTAYNAWTKRMRDELIDAYQTLETDPNVRVIVLTGDPAGRAFCAGADLSLGDFTTKPGKTETLCFIAEARDGGGRFTLPVFRSRKITVAAINGSAAGIGITQTLPMDLRFAWKDAKIVFPFTRRGIVPEAASSYFLPQLIGRSRALAVLLQASPSLPASSPLLDGLFAHLLPAKDDVLPYALKVARELAENVSPASVAYAKSLILHAEDSPEKQHLLDSRAMHVLGNMHDGREGVKAFLEKRKPDFQNFDTGDLPGWLRGAKL
ncbi:ClpP/crotonase-like domain-containing protein [Hysterangium stoloniferum]|nr:ClpP/crotonase-like domain-containing protein [Hysterangium stoloniferum]